jgi:uncharacterized protein
MSRILSLVLLLFPAIAHAQAVTPPAEPPRTLTVSAVGTVELEPEQGVVLLAVESEGETAQAAARANAERMTRLMTALRRAGVPEREIRTTSYELRPEYARDDRGAAAPRITGYRAVNMVQVTVDTVARLGGIVDAAIASGANRVANIRFQLRDPEEAHLQASAAAVRSARRQAEAIAAAAGERLGAPLSINTSGYVPRQEQAVYARMEMAQQDFATPIEGGTLMVVANVHVVYRLLD